MEGDATRPSILKQVGLDRTDAIAAMTDTMAANLSVAMLVDRIVPSVWTVVRAHLTTAASTTRTPIPSSTRTSPVRGR